MENSLFSSIGNISSTKSVTLKNLIFVNYGGNSIVDTVSQINALTINDLKIHSFKKDINNFSNFNGIIDNLGIDFSKSPTSVQLNRCFIDDEFATINTGFISNLIDYDVLEINHSRVFSNTKKNAFISYDRLALNPWVDTDANNLSSTKDIPNRNQYSRTLSINYCSNFGDTTSLVTATSGKFYAASSSFSSLKWSLYQNNQQIFPTLYSKVNINNTINYGNASGELFINSMKYYAVQSTTTGSYYSRNYLIAEPFASNFKILKFMNFGSCKAISNIKTQTNDGWNKLPSNFEVTGYSFYLRNHLTYSSFSISIQNSFNAGKTTIISSESLTNDYKNLYYYSALVSIEEEKWLDISNLNQINKDFFVNTLGLDETKWNLDYINILDEYGLPSIIY